MVSGGGIIMLYYRYRPSGELSLKELRYNEIYFSSVKESNDPYDGKVFLSYRFDKDKWKRILEMAWKNLLVGGTLSSLVNSLSEHLEKNCPNSFEETINYDYCSVLLDNNSSLDFLTAYHLDILIKQFIDIYRPEARYTVSFSKKKDNTLMWSHYASKHKGFCLIFKDIKGFLYQDREHQKLSIRRKTPKSAVSNLSSLEIEEGFLFEDVEYCSNNKMIDASRFMPHNILRKHFKNEEERINFVTENDKECLKKHSCWEYEKESRLLLYEPMPWFFGEHFELTKEERLLHYQPTQLVGIILGALMEPEIKERVREIIHVLRERITKTTITGPLFDFVLFEASISDKHRDLEIKPKEIFIETTPFSNNDPQFPSQYKKWKNGEAIVFDGKGGSRKQVFS
jgi:hypothetical protein